ncbi:hypothetical protein SPI_07177 [Niveomyces insectorum RCEF 264]|uniref:Uncharacterized protein n=1 Tax=Niveomyces insectorum RCEF 264 TaxID=1081102 RepID=A0A167QCP7_9HYPO|nr:hypothetical protein SPI_07177 [Niveomyces insectorum RCEF 264]
MSFECPEFRYREAMLLPATVGGGMTRVHPRLMAYSWMYGRESITKSSQDGRELFWAFVPVHRMAVDLPEGHVKCHAGRSPGVCYP